MRQQWSYVFLALTPRYVLQFIIIISVISLTSHCIKLNHETMVCTVCVALEICNVSCLVSILQQYNSAMQGPSILTATHHYPGAPFINMDYLKSQNRIIWEAFTYLLPQKAPSLYASRPRHRVAILPVWGRNTKHRISNASHYTISQPRAGNRRNWSQFDRVLLDENGRYTLCNYAHYISDFVEISANIAH